MQQEVAVESAGDGTSVRDRKRAREEFAQVFRIFPTAQIDRETFSPKTVELFEQVRAEVVTAGANRKP